MPLRRSSVSREMMNFKPVRESCSFLFLVAATQQVCRKPRFRLATRPPTRTEASTHEPRAPRAHHAPRFPTGLASREPAIANAKSHRTETDPSPPPLRHTRPRRTQTHTMPKKRRANGRNKPAGARGHVRAPSPRVSSDRNRARDRTRTARVFGPTRGPARRSRGPQRHTPRRPERTPSASRALARE